MEYIFIAGGYSGDQGFLLDTVERFTVRSNKIELLSWKLPKRIQSNWIVQINPEEIICFGGYEENSGPISDVYIINGNSGKSIRKGDLGERACGTYSPFFVDGQFFLFAFGNESTPPTPIRYKLV